MDSTVSPSPGILSLRRAAAILQALSRTHRLSVAELGQEVGLPPATVTGLLRTLELDGLVERDRFSGKFQLGASVLPMGFRYLEASALRAAALNSAHALARSTRARVRVGELHGTRVLTVHQVAEPGDGRLVADIGSLAPVHATAVGKALLAQDQGLVAILRSAPLRAYTPATITEMPRLERELTEVTEHGWACEIGELASGMASIAAPISAGSNVTPAALGIEGPIERLVRDGTPRQDLVRSVLDGAHAVGRELQAVPWLR